MDPKQIYKQLLQLINSNPDQLDVFFKNMMEDNYDNEEYWKYILDNTTLTDAFIKDHLDQINITYLFKYQMLSDEMLLWLKDNTPLFPKDLENMVVYQSLSTKMIQHYIDNMYPIDWGALVSCQELPSEIIEKYHDDLDWDDVTEEQFLTLELIEKFSDKVNWKTLPLNMKTQYLFNDAFVEFFKDKIVWDNIGYMDGVSLDCILRHKDRLNESAWKSVLMFKRIESDKLEIVIGACKGVVEQKDAWHLISTDQILTREFIDKHADHLDWDSVSSSQHLDWELINKYHDRISLYQLSRNDCITKELVEKIEQHKDLFQDTLDEELVKTFIA